MNILTRMACKLAIWIIFSFLRLSSRHCIYIYPPRKQVQLDVHKCYRFQLKNNMEMRLPLFIYLLFVQEDIIIHDHLFKIY